MISKMHFQWEWNWEMFLWLFSLQFVAYLQWSGVRFDIPTSASSFGESSALIFGDSWQKSWGHNYLFKNSVSQSQVWFFLRSLWTNDFWVTAISLWQNRWGKKKEYKDFVINWWLFLKANLSTGQIGYLDMYTIAN